MSPRSNAARRRCSPRSSSRCSRRGTRRGSAHRRRARRAARAARRGPGAAVRHESAQRLLGELRSELVEARAPPDGPSAAELGLAADAADAAARAAARERDDLQARAALAAERLAALEHSLAEREGLPPAARALAEEGERLVLQLVTAEPGRERAVAAALGHRASAVVADDPRGAGADRARPRVGPRPGAGARRPRPGRARPGTAGGRRRRPARLRRCPP